MRKFILFSIAITLSLVFHNCGQVGNSLDSSDINIPLDSLVVAPFFQSYPELQKYEKELITIYRGYSFNYIWFDNKGVVEYGNSLYSKVIDIESEGISATFPYQTKIDDIFKDNIINEHKSPEAELFLTSLYLFYVDEVYKGIDHKYTTDIGWLLPRKKVDYTTLLDSIISDNKLQHQDSLTLFSQYYKLRDALKHYRDIEKNGGWRAIEFEENVKAYKPNDTSRVIQQIRERLYVTGDIYQNNRSNTYDTELVEAVKTFQMHNGFKPDSIISRELINAMNVTVGECIKIIIVNMERCRWISPEIFKANKYIFVNIPSYNLSLIDSGRLALESPVVVGDSMTKTVIFGGKMSYLVFSPYWNLPKSIIEKEVVPGIEKNKNYLKTHNMEWNNGRVRQLPGKNNSLGLVKFMFPNSNDIYLHDSPAKSLFNDENRAMSHGCVRVGKAKELAMIILKDDKKWTHEKINAAMHAK